MVGMPARKGLNWIRADSGMKRLRFDRKGFREVLEGPGRFQKVPAREEGFGIVSEGSSKSGRFRNSSGSPNRDIIRTLSHLMGLGPIRGRPTPPHLLFKGVGSKGGALSLPSTSLGRNSPPPLAALSSRLDLDSNFSTST